MAKKIIKSHAFKCPECNRPVVANKVEDDSMSDVVEGKVFTGMTIEVNHPKPECNSYLGMSTPDYLRTAMPHA